jgi:uncharacterized membrane protein
MADFRLIIFAVIMSVFSIASNSILLNKEHVDDSTLNDNEKNFAIVSLVGSILVLLAAMYYGFKGRSTMRNSAANYIRG